MSVTVRHYGKIVNGQKIYSNPELYKKQLQELEGQEFEEIIKKRHRKVSLDQHAFYRHGVLGTAMQHEAFSHFNKADDLHEEIADMFLGYTVLVKIGNQQYNKKKVRSTADLSKDEMREFIEKVIAWLAVEFGIVVLSPEQYYSQYAKTITYE